MKRITILFFFASLIGQYAFSQAISKFDIIKDEYIMHDHRVIEISGPRFSVSKEMNVSVTLLYFKTKGSPDHCNASFCINYERTNPEYISYPLVIKTAGGKIFETFLGKVRHINKSAYSPSTLNTIIFDVNLDKKSIKYFTKDNVERMKIRVDKGTIDLVFSDATLSNYIREGYKYLKDRSKIELPESANPPKYKGF